MEQINHVRVNHGAEKVQLEKNQPSKGKQHA
jgi:hypothetical protein